MRGPFLSRPHGGLEPFRLVCLISCLAASLCPSVLGQLYSGSVTGVVTDPSGAVIPGAKLSLTDVGKGYTSNATTDAVGRYILRNLPPSTYKLAVEAVSFKTYVQDGITIDVNQNITIDVQLIVGSAAESVQVVAAPPVLAAQDAVTGQELNRTFINDLPLIERSVFDLAFLTPGVYQNAGNGTRSSGSPNNFISNGGRGATADILIDGVTTTNIEQEGGIQIALYEPSIDAVQEFKVQQSNFSAEIGFSGATVVNMVTRSGTNEFHGSAFEFLRNNVLTANNWFNNASGTPLAPRRRNVFGGTVGGPIRKNKTFFFFDYEGTRDRQAHTLRAGVPSALERTGDFGELCGFAGGSFDSQGRCSSPEGQLWDPYTSVFDANQGGPVRQSYIPFNNMATYVSPGNPNLNGTPFQLAPVAGNLIDPVAQKMMNYYPLPNLNVGNAAYDQFNNWLSTGATPSGNDQWDIKIDHSFSEKDRLSAKFSRGLDNSREPNCFHNPGDPCSNGQGLDHRHVFSLTENHIINPKTLLNFTFGVTRIFFWGGKGGQSDYPGVDPVKTLGMPAYMLESGIPQLPGVYVSDYGSAGQVNALGSQPWGYFRNGNETFHLLTMLDRVQSRHELKLGWEGRMHRLNNIIAGAPGGVFSYDRTSTTEFPSSGGGDAMASLLTGVAGPGGWGEYQTRPEVATQSFQYAGYIQDNWRTSDKLTLNMGLRYDLNLSRTERYNRQSYFDPNAVSPLQPPCLAGERCLGTLHGGLQFVTPSMRTNFGVNYHSFGPRFGFAYRFTNKMVLRGGYGLFYSTTRNGVAGNDTEGYAGFDQEDNWITTDPYVSDPVTPWGRLSDPWPITGPPLPPGNKLGLKTDVGTGSFRSPIRSITAVPYEQTWSFGIQRELPSSIVIDANYVGKRGTKLWFGGGGGINHLGSFIEHLSPAELAVYLNSVPNPFAGIIPSGADLSSQSIPLWQLSRPFPQFTGFTVGELPISNSIYHAFQLKVEKRFSHGLQFLATYTASKSIDDASVSSGDITWLGGGLLATSLQDPNNRKLERSLSQFDIPQVLQFAYVYELPVGRGKAIGGNMPPVLNAVIGGWKTNGIWRFSSGQPVGLSVSSGQSLPTYGGQRPNLLGQLKINDRSKWFCSDPDCGYFANQGTDPNVSTAVAVVPPPFTLGTAPRTLPNVRNPGLNIANLSVFKEIPLSRLREGMRLEYRAEAFNALNHPHFCGPNSTIDSGSFGQITGTCDSAREIQMALKLYW